MDDKDRYPRTWKEVAARIARYRPEGSVEAMRTAFDALTAGDRPDHEVVDLDGIEALAIGRGAETLLWLHGGCGVFGSPESHLQMAAAIAAEGVRVVLPRYPLAPEARWPQILEGATRALDALNATLPAGSPYSPAIVGGCGFGGHLALALALARPNAVNALALLSPNTVRTGNTATRAALSALDPLGEDERDAACAALVLADLDRTDPLVSPALAAPPGGGFPEVHIEVGAREVLLDDALILARNYAVRYVTISLHVTRETGHLEALWPQASPGARAQLSRIGRFAAGEEDGDEAEPL